MELLQNALRSVPEKVAIASGKRTFSYVDLLKRSEEIASFLLGLDDFRQGDRIAFMVAPSFEYVTVQWGIWRAGGVAVPMALSYPLPELEFVIDEVECSRIIAGSGFENQCHALAEKKNIPFVYYEDIKSGITDIPEIEDESPAMILFTSGTTSKPKGVIITHKNILSQVRSLHKAWEWSENDHILNVLPLHHVHGITNVVTCALGAGASLEFLPAFDARTVWDRFLTGKFTLFMAVPTIYARLIAHFEESSPQRRAALSRACGSFRLMVSGSAALPVSILEKWEQISGHRLLERYGMTEIGMAISNPYHGERRRGCIGQPLPGVQVRLLNENLQEVPDGEPGEIFVKSENVFKGYWGREAASREAFVDGWFRTGDIAVLENGYYRILGRDSVDIIKSGGYKISALEIEEVYRQHPEIRDCAVVGVPDDEWGEMVSIAFVSDAEPDGEALAAWGKQFLAPYKVPRNFLAVIDLPRNALGKVLKPQVKALFS